MNVFKFITPTGQPIEVTGPPGSTQDQAAAVYNQQLSTGSLTGLRSGDVLNSLVQAKAGLATALSQVTGISPNIAAQVTGALVKIPNLPPTFPVEISTFVNTSVLASTPVGPLSAPQVQGLMAATATSVNQSPTTVTNDKGLGTYGLTPNQLQQAGLIKPGTADLIAQDPANAVSILNSPTVWTGKDGATDLNSVLANPTLQASVQQNTMANSYNQLTQLGVVDNSSALPATDVGAIVNNATNFGVGPTINWLKNTVGGGQFEQLTTSAVNSLFGQNFGTINEELSGGGNPLQTGIQAPQGYNNTVDRSVINSSFNAIIGNDKVPKTIFANPATVVEQALAQAVPLARQAVNAIESAVKSW